MPKLITTISLFIFWAVVTAILAAGLIYYQKSNLPVDLNSGTGATNFSTTTLNLLEIAKHNSASNCWMIISGKVYNFTSYISRHPGRSSMVPYCGLDGTSAFLSGPPHSHSTFAQSLLSQYYIGDLNQTTSVQQIQH